MMKLTREDDRFYEILGPVFGSRVIQRVTTDRFYDDEEKTWYLDMDETGDILYVFSVKKHVLKNIYVGDADAAVEGLKEAKEDIKSGRVTKLYESLYKEAGFLVKDYSVNYVDIVG